MITMKMYHPQRYLKQAFTIGSRRNNMAKTPALSSHTRLAAAQSTNYSAVCHSAGSLVTSVGICCGDGDDCIALDEVRENGVSLQQCGME